MMINTNATEPSAKADFTVGGISGRFRTLYIAGFSVIYKVLVVIKGTTH